MSQTSEQRREQIVQTARRIVDEQGPGRLTAEAITREIGVSRPLLYHYFENVSKLLDAVVDMYADEFAAALAAWDEGSAQDATSLAHLLRERLAGDNPLFRAAGEPAGAAAYRTLVQICADRTAQQAADHPDGALAGILDAEDAATALQFAFGGLTAALVARPDASDETLAFLFGKLWGTGAAAASAAPAVPAAAPAERPAPAAHESEAAPRKSEAAAPAPVPEPAPAPKPAEQPAPAAPAPAPRHTGLFGKLFGGR